MTYISYDDLEVVFELLEKEVEMCGFLLETQSNALQLYVDNIGEFKNGIGLCQHSEYTKYIWHTHPYTTKPYPSAEDVIKVLKYRQSGYPEESLIFSSWGVWELCASSKIKLDDVWLQYLLNITKEAFGSIYHITEKGSKPLNSRSLEFIQNVIDGLQYNINRRHDFGFQMSFTPWKQIQSNRSYFLRF